MATVTTTSQTDVLCPPGQGAIFRELPTGRLFCLVRTATSTLTVYRSIDSGGSWSSFASFSHTGLQEWSRLVIDRNGYAHIAYRVGDGTSDTDWYRRLNLNSASWSSGLQTSNTDANGGVNGSRSQSLDIAVVRNSNGSYAIAVCIAYNYTNNTYGIALNGVSISTSGTISLNNGIILNKRFWVVTGTPPGKSGIACEVEHNGDGFTAQTPHLWIAWGRDKLCMVKLAWQGSSVGWSGPSNHQTIRTGLSQNEWVSGRFDGNQWLMPVINPDDSTSVRVYQRNRANTVTTVFDGPAHPAGNIRNYALSYDHTTKDIRVFAVGTSNNDLYFVDYDRGLGTWSSWATVSTTDILGTGNAEWGIRPGGTSHNARFDVITAHSGSPNTIVHTAQTTSSTPNIATWNTASVPYFNGGAADVSASLLLDWDFTDPDAGQGQGSYALSRQIGAGALQYWNAGSSTWGGSEVQNSSATTQVTLASSWASGSDANYTFRVKVWDSNNTPAAGYSSPLVIIPSVKVNPTVSTPTNAQVLNVDTVTTTWTVSEQTAYRVRLLTNPGSVLMHDSGFIGSTDTSYQIPVVLPTGTGYTIELATKNNERLESNTVTRNFSVAYAPPPAMLNTSVGVPASGWITSTPSALAPVGLQPAIVSADVYRRAATTPVLNSNPDMNGNVTGWSQGGGGAAGTLTYSTTQSRSAPGSARYVPPAASGAVTQTVAQTALVDLVAGALYYGSGWIRPDTANKSAVIRLDWHDAASTYLSSATVTMSTPVAVAWQFLEVIGDPSLVANAAKVRVSIGLTSTPASADAWYADEIRLRLYNEDPGVAVARIQQATVPVNDWGAASRTDYEYRWVAIGANGTSVSGPWM